MAGEWPLKNCTEIGNPWELEIDRKLRWKWDPRKWKENQRKDTRDKKDFTWDRQGIVCKVRTQDPENFHEEVKSLVTAWWIYFLGFQSLNPSWATFGAAFSEGEFLCYKYRNQRTEKYETTRELEKRKRLAQGQNLQ